MGFFNKMNHMMWKVFDTAVFRMVPEIQENTRKTSVAATETELFGHIFCMVFMSLAISHLPRELDSYLSLWKEGTKKWCGAQEKNNYKNFILEICMKQN